VATDIATQLERVQVEAAELRRMAAEQAERNNELTGDLGQAKAVATDIAIQLEHVQVEAAELRRIAAERAEAARSLEAILRREIGEKSAEIAALKQQLESVTAERDASRAAVERAQAANDQVREDLDVAATRIAAYLAEHGGAKERAEALAQSMAVEARFRNIENQMASVSATVNSIVTSRIWRTLVRGGGWVQVLLARARPR
jgi:chromosome segregation ATPase